jgi:aryl carrier-like protein
MIGPTMVSRLFYRKWIPRVLLRDKLPVEPRLTSLVLLPWAPEQAWVIRTDVLAALHPQSLVLDQGKDSNRWMISLNPLQLNRSSTTSESLAKWPTDAWIGSMTCCGRDHFHGVAAMRIGESLSKMVTSSLIMDRSMEAVATDGAVAGVVEGAWETHGEMTDEAVTKAQRSLTAVRLMTKYCITYIASKVRLRGGRAILISLICFSMRRAVSHVYIRHEDLSQCKPSSQDWAEPFSITRRSLESCP